MSGFNMDIEKIINTNALKDRLENDFELFKELAELFIKESPKLLAAVEEAVKNKNALKIGKTAHTIKGAISNFSAEKAYQAALNLEKIGINNELDKVESALINLASEVTEMQKALSAMMAENHL
jgi:HPt (histidine-containing phosphotransfer) domain-containing protein